MESVSSVCARNADSTNAVPVWSQLGRLQWSWETCLAHSFMTFNSLLIATVIKKVLVKREGDHWVLPGRLYPRPEFKYVYEPVHILLDVQKIIGSTFPPTFLRVAWRRTRTVKEKIMNMKYINEYEKCVILMACDEEYIREQDASRWKQDYLWMAVQQVNVSHLIEEAAAAIEKELKFVENGTQPENRLAWQRPGWLRSASSWMIEQLRLKRDAVLCGEITHLRSSHISTIPQAETTEGRFFLKCTSCLWNDAAYTEALSRLSPLYVAAPVAVDVGRQMMVTADYGKILNPGRFSDAEKKQLAVDFARLQMATVGKAEEIISAGFPDFRLPKLVEHVD